MGRLPEREVLFLRPEAFGLPSLHEKQLQFLHMPQKHVEFVGGFGSGKTVALLYWAVCEAMDPINRRGTIGLAAPTYAMSDEVHRSRLLQMFDRFAEIHGFSLLEREDKGRNAFHLIGGGRILRFSYRNNPERNLGLEFAALGLDEPDAELGGDAALMLLSSRVRGVGSLRIRVTTTPRGYQGATRVFLDARQTPEGKQRWGVVHCPSHANPGLAPEVLNGWKTTMSNADWRQFVLAEVLRPGAAVYPELSHKRHLLEWFPGKGRDVEWYASIDWGYSTSVVLCGARRTGVHPDAKAREVLVVFEEVVLDEQAETAPIDALEKIVKEMGCDPAAIFPDRARPDLNGKLRRRFPSVRVQGKGSKKQQSVWPGVERVRGALDPNDGGPPKLLFSRRLAERGHERGIWRSIENLERRRKDGVPIDEVRPDPKWEHMADALRYLWDGAMGPALIWDAGSSV